MRSLDAPLSSFSLSTHIHVDLGRNYPPRFESPEQAVGSVEIILKDEGHFQGLDLKGMEASVKPLNSSPNCRRRIWGKGVEGGQPFLFKQRQSTVQEHRNGELFRM